MSSSRSSAAYGEISSHPRGDPDGRQKQRAGEVSMRSFLATVGAVGALFALVFGTQLVSAHHSTTMFDHSKTLTIRGIAVELRWVNPHVSLLVKGVVDGN